MSIIKAIASDLDGTLLRPDHKISKFSEVVIKQAIKEGFKFFIATGRSLEETESIVNVLNLKDTFYITLNGAEVFDSNWNLILNHLLDEEVVNKIIDLKNQEKYKSIVYSFYKGKHIYIEKKVTELYKNQIDKYEHINHGIKTGRIKLIDSIDDLRPLNNIKKIIASHDEEVLIEFEIDLLSKYKNKVNAYISTPNSLEIVNKEVSKGRALKEALSKYNINMQEAIAFGDGFNDYDMLKNVGKGFIMENANYRLKEALPNLEIIQSCAEDAVARKINNHYLQYPISLD